MRASPRSHSISVLTRRAVSAAKVRTSLLDRKESLHAFAGEHLAGVNNALGVDGNHVQAVPLTCVLAHAAHLPQYLSVFAVEEVDMVVRQIRNVQEPLLLVRGERHAAGRASLAGLRRGYEFLQ